MRRPTTGTPCIDRWSFTGKYSVVCRVKRSRYLTLIGHPVEDEWQSVSIQGGTGIHDLKVQVRSGAVACVAQLAEHLSPLHMIAFADDDAARCYSK